MFYLVRTPKFISKLVFPGYTWNVETTRKELFLTFDDGPHPEVTPFVLDALKGFNAKATFFCIGKNVAQHPDLYRRILVEGHRVGNHTMNHLNGWETDDAVYLNNIREAAKYIDSNLYRPPYGKVTAFQAQQLREALHYKIIMWSVLSGDFDVKISADRCWKNVKNSAKHGSIVVFHDSEKAMTRMKPALVKTLQHFSEQDFAFNKLG